MSLEEALEELETAEEFLTYFGIHFDQTVVHVNRLHIMQRFHDYLTKVVLPEGDDVARQDVYRVWLARAYLDFVESDAITEKVFKVFRMNEPQKTFVPLSQLLG